MSLVYNEFKRANAAGEIDLDADDIRVALLMTNTTVDAENDGTATLSNYTDLDECDGANYARQALTSEAVVKDDGNDRASFDADNPTWNALGNGTRANKGALVYKHVTDDTDSIPIAFIEFGSPQNPGGSNFTVTWHANGILTLS